MLHYDPQQVSSRMLLILRRTNCITTASGVVTLEIGERSYINKMRFAVLLKKIGIKQYWNKIAVIREVNPSELTLLWCTVRKTSNYEIKEFQLYWDF
jgi:hypothetical protein